MSTSPGNLQAWLTVKDQLPGQNALWVTKELTRVFAGDKGSAKATQQGRLPGSTNVKVGKGNLTNLLHCQVQDMDDDESRAQVTSALTDA